MYRKCERSGLHASSGRAGGKGTAVGLLRIGQTRGDGRSEMTPGEWERAATGRHEETAQKCQALCSMHDS